MFSGISDSCAKLTTPAMDAIREYTGDLFSAAVEFEDSTGQPSPDRRVKVCSAAYVAPGTPAESQSTNGPVRRVVTLAFEVHLGDDPINSAKLHLDRARDNSEGSATTGLGDESFDGSGSTTETTAITAFRKSNGYVDVSVSGSNASGQKGKANPNAELSDLTPGARAIAKALADNIGAVFTLR